MNTIAGIAREKLQAALPPDQFQFVLWQERWIETARVKQLPPQGDWTELGYMAGRGFGKTRVGAEWLGAAAWRDPLALPSAVIAPTFSDIKHVCFEGPAGLCAVIPPELVKSYNKTDMILILNNGAPIRGFSAEQPERLRGPQHARMWADEVAAWQYDEDTWDMAMMGLRLGPLPQALWTTTPKPKELIRKLIAPREGRIIVRGTTYENKANLPAVFFRQLTQYEGTVLGRQELEGELIDPEESGIVRRKVMRLWPANKPLPPLDWIIMSLDTAFTEKTRDAKTNDPDFSACTVWGGFQYEKAGHVLLLDCWQERYGFPELLERVKKELNVTYGDDQDVAVIKPMFGGSKPTTSGRKVDIVVIEEKGSGISLRQALYREGIATHPYNPGRADKLTRLHIVSPIFARRQVWLPESDRFPGKPRTWAETMIYQLCSFTGSGSIKFDDYVDSCTQALRVLMDKGMLRAIEKSVEPPPDPEPPRKQVINPYAV